jgi:ankyrin repeat protein
MTSEEAGEDRASLNKQLLEACLMGDGERVRRLLEEGADVNARDGCGNTPLHLAVHFGGMLDRDLGFEWITVLKWLVERGADLNARDAEGRTPLHDAAMLGYDDAINVLLPFREDLPRADPNARDNYGKTPLHYIAEKRNVDGIRLLKEHARSRSQPLPPVKPLARRIPFNSFFA